MQRGGAADRLGQRLPVDAGELDARGDAGIGGGKVGVDHRIGQTAGARHHRYAAIGEAIELRQAARLEPAGHENRVAARLHPVRQRLVIADAHGDAAGMARGGLVEARFQRRIARPQQRKTPADPDEMVDRFEQDVHALLPGEPADHHEQRTVAGFQRELLLQRPFVGGAFCQRASAEIRLERGIDLRVPLLRVDAVDDAAHPIAPADDQPFQTHAEFGQADFTGIGGADGGDGAGRFHPGLQEADAAVIFHAVHGPGLGRQVEQREKVASEIALERHVVDGHHRGQGLAVKGREPQIGERHARLPVVRVDQVETVLLRRAAGDIGRRAPERGIAPPVVAPIVTEGIDIGAAVALEKARRVQHQQRMIAQLAGQQPRRLPQQGIPGVDRLRLAQRLQHGGVARQQRGHLHAMRGQCIG